MFHPPSKFINMQSKGMFAIGAVDEDCLIDFISLQINNYDENYKNSDE